MTAPIDTPDDPQSDPPSRVDQPFAAKGVWMTIGPVPFPMDTTEYAVVIDSPLDEGVLVEYVIDFSPDGGKTWASQFPAEKVPRELNPFPVSTFPFIGGSMVKDAKEQETPLLQYSRSLKTRPRHFLGGAPMMRVGYRTVGSVDCTVPMSLLWTNAGEKAVEESVDPIWPASPQSELV